MPAFLLLPKGEGRGPALLAAHGHGRGKADICGLSAQAADKGHAAWVRETNYEYALHAVRRGYVVLAPDWAPFGERRPPEAWVRGYRDACDMIDTCLGYFGATLLASNIRDGLGGVDLLAAHPRVDARRMGVIGLSYGGTMALHLLIHDPRLKAGVVSGYLSTLKGDAFGMRGLGNTCGAQAVPGLLLHGDIPEMAGLAAPKPMLCEMGRREDCFHYPDMKRAYARLSRIYRAAGAAGRLERDDFDGKHRWSGRKAWDFLERWL